MSSRNGRRVTALRCGTTSRLVPDSGAWASAPLQCPITLRDFLQHLTVVLQVPHLKVVCRSAHLTVVRGGTTQHWCAFALSVDDQPHLTLVRRVTALQYGTTSRLVPDSSAWASAPLQCPRCSRGCTKTRSSQRGARKVSFRVANCLNRLSARCSKLGVH